MRGSIAGALAIVSGLAFATMEAPIAEAQGGGHAHAAPHGGEVSAAGSHHVEFKADSTGTIQVWLLDGKEKTVAPPADGRVTLMAGSENQVTLPLQVDKAAQRLTAKFDPRKFTSFTAVVSLPIDGKRQNIRFRYPHAGG